MYSESALNSVICLFIHLKFAFVDGKKRKYNVLYVCTASSTWNVPFNRGAMFVYFT